jgi:hypothetical protein
MVFGRQPENDPIFRHFIYLQQLLLVTVLLLSLHRTFQEPLWRL